MRKRKMAMKENDKKTITINIAVSILLVVVLSFISVGYALYGQILNIGGRTTFNPQGKIAIKNVELLSSKNVKDGSIPAFTDDSVDFNLTFEKPEGSTENDYQAVYRISIENGTFYNYEFNLANFQPVITNSSGINVDPSYLTFELNGINIGDNIPASETVTFTLTMNFNPIEDDTYSVDGNLETDDVLEEQPHGSLLGSIPDNATGDLRESLGNDSAEFTVTVINSYQSARTFNLNIGDTAHFKLTNSSGNPLQSFTIEGGTTNTYTFYVRRVDNAVYTSSSLTTNITLSYNDVSNINCGGVTLLVDEQELEDTTPPLISNVTVTQNNATSDNTSNNNVGSVTVSWTGSDPESGVKKYYIVVDNGTAYEQNVSSGTSYTVTGLADGSHTFKVYGENNDGYKASDDDIANGNTDYCASTSSSFIWHYTVSLSTSSQYMQALTDTKVNRGYNYTTTLKANANTNNYTYTLPNTITVSMGGSNISTGTTTGRYQYTNSSGALTVYGVTGNISITARATRSNTGGGC
ncbi:MAG: fibronectin type III domain-containing protein [Bacilli bacterium]|nr:fibronectin type III domain-containing protein [Bacilli bacterium]